jgi:phosphatidylglycerophosphate synthase
LSQATGAPTAGQAAPLFKAPDVLTSLRIPLAVAFLVIESAAVRLGIVFLAAASDVADGIWARRTGGSRAGVVLDPIADKLFMVAAFVVVLRGNVLSMVEIVGVLIRDITAAVAFLTTVLRRKPTTLPASAGGKAVTILQGLTLVAFLAGSDLLRPLAWATGAVSLYAIYDYSRQAWRP